MSTTVVVHKRQWRFWVGLALPVLAGLVFWETLPGSWLEGVSYDLLYLFKPTVRPDGIVIIYMDEPSYRALGQDPKNAWSRALHARLLDRLTQDRARLVVFDIIFDYPSSPVEDEELRKAIKKNGRVVLAGSVSERSFPLKTFQDAARNWGFCDLVGSPEEVKRRCYPNSERGFNLPWAAAVATGTNAAPLKSQNAWLNYYGPYDTIRRVSYCDASIQEPGFFDGKVVFVGDDLHKVAYALRRSDAHRTPYSRWGGQYLPGVEIMATGYLNLVRNEGLIRLSEPLQSLVIIACGALLGWGAVRLKIVRATTLTIGVVMLVFSVSLVLHWKCHMWFAWMVVAGVQAPTAFAWSVAVWLRKAEPKPEFSLFPRYHGKGLIPNIPDHTLVQRIGVGAYGEVWLAQNAIGMFRAVKFVFRDRYSSPDPYQREFKGIEKYMPISLNHTGLVHLLHVGRNDGGGYFFYIMEAGDDETSGQQIDAAKYTPKNLTKELAKRGRFSVEECVTLGLHLTTVLNYLHGRRLIHRDIKPSNIIYVGGAPKLADIGLVTDIASKGRVLTYVGTEGYIPPEGPGTAGGDVYSLGKVLYEAAMGRDRLQYPDLPTSVVEGKAKPGLLQLNEIILKACETDPDRRYRSAATMHEDLLELQQSLLQKVVMP